MQTLLDDFPLEYEFVPSPEAEERLARAWDLIISLILADIESEQELKSEGETC